MTDAERIDALGGAARVAGLLGLTHYGTQRVHNWKTRGIPALIKLQRPDLFPYDGPVGPGAKAPVKKGSARG